MTRILRFDAFNNLSEKIQHVTSNWYAISDEASFHKKEESGYFVFNQSGIFSVIYSKSNNEKASLDFYVSKESSPDSSSLCSCNIINEAGDIIESKKFNEINSDTIWDILSLFFDYCDLEKADKAVIDRFLLGFTKSLKVIFAHDSKDSLPASFKSFCHHVEKECKNTKELKDSKLDYKYKILRVLKDFVKFYTKTI